MGGVTLASIALEVEAGDAYIDRALVLNPNLALQTQSRSGTSCEIVDLFDSIC
jgi:hypothetical protein